MGAKASYSALAPICYNVSISLEPNVLNPDLTTKCSHYSEPKFTLPVHKLSFAHQAAFAESPRYFLLPVSLG